MFFSYHTMLSLLLWIFNIWILVWKFLHYYSNHTLTPWIIFYLTGIFCNSTWKLINFCLFVVIVFYFFEEYHRNFDWDCTEPVVSFHFGRMVWWFELNSFFKKKVMVMVSLYNNRTLTKTEYGSRSRVLLL